jgi:acetylornithine deacetylase/succinyl-diaminopimelate desuccinylase-like protein
MVSAQLQVRGPQRDVHSGAVSGPAPNPVIELSRLVAQLHDEDGRITLPRFYDDVPEPDPEDWAALAALPYTDEDWLRRSETSSVGRAASPVGSRPDQRPVDYELTIPVESGQEPYRTPPDTPALTALREAMADGWKCQVDDVGFMGNAGGSPASLLHDVTGAPIVFFGTGLPVDHCTTATRAS